MDGTRANNNIDCGDPLREPELLSEEIRGGEYSTYTFPFRLDVVGEGISGMQEVWCFGLQILLRRTFNVVYRIERLPVKTKKLVPMTCPASSPKANPYPNKYHATKLTVASPMFFSKMCCVDVSLMAPT